VQNRSHFRWRLHINPCVGLAAQQPSDYGARLPARAVMAWRERHDKMLTAPVLIDPIDLPVAVTDDARVEAGCADH
jgi:hypothetical protein